LAKAKNVITTSKYAVATVLVNGKLHDSTWDAMVPGYLLLGGITNRQSQISHFRLLAAALASHDNSDQIA
jgi:hypothetical protein